MNRIAPHVVCILLLWTMNMVFWMKTGLVVFAGLQAWFAFLDEVDPDFPRSSGRRWVVRLTRLAIGVGIYYGAFAAASMLWPFSDLPTTAMHRRAIVLPASVGAAVLIVVMSFVRLTTPPATTPEPKPALDP